MEMVVVGVPWKHWTHYTVLSIFFHKRGRFAQRWFRAAGILFIIIISGFVLELVNRRGDVPV